MILNYIAYKTEQLFASLPLHQLVSQLYTIIVKQTKL